MTKNIRLGPAGSCCPITTRPNSPTASRCSIISPGPAEFRRRGEGLPSDWAMFNVDGMSGQNRDMTREALEIILKMWTDDAPWTYKGKFWTVNKPDTMFDFLKPHIKPKQAPHPPIGVAGLSKNSDTLKLAGERGFIPMSLNLNPAYVGSHWDRWKPVLPRPDASRTARTGGWCARCSSPIPMKKPGSSRPAT